LRALANLKTRRLGKVAAGASGEAHRMKYKTGNIENQPETRKELVNQVWKKNNKNFWEICNDPVLENKLTVNPNIR
jgi:hypothetical protein